MPLFDVILPTSRRPHTLPYAISSVLDQSVRDLTLHVVGDGCDARTEEIVRAFDDPRLRFHRLAKGPGFGYGNRNTVLREGSAPLVAYMTDDDLLFPDHLEYGLRALENPGLSLVAFPSAQVRYPDDLDLHFFVFDWKLGAASRFLTRWFIGSANMIHRRALFDRIGFWNEKLLRFGDREFYRRACDSGDPAALMSEPTILRFFAAQWDRRYETLAKPPQEKYLGLLRSPEWCLEARRRASQTERPLSVRVGQARDFLSFALKSGPKFIRHLVGRH